MTTHWGLSTIPKIVIYTTEEESFPMNINYLIQPVVLDLLALRWKEKLTQTVSLTPNNK